MPTLLGPRARATTTIGFAQVFGRFLLAGLVGGLLASAWLLLVTERAIHAALVVEEARPASAGHDALVSRSTQLAGGVLGTVITGVVLGVLFATAFALVRHRLPGRTDLARATVLAAIGFGIAALLPAVVIPANPPGVGDEATVTTRTTIYGAVLLCGLVIAVGTGVLVGVLRDRGVKTASAAVAATVLAGTVTALVVLLVPGNPDVVPADMPSAVVWRFRLASLGQLLVLWAGMGVLGGWLLDRYARRRRASVGPGRLPLPEGPEV